MVLACVKLVSKGCVRDWYRSLGGEMVEYQNGYVRYYRI
jgi:hypothetical protein